VNFIPDIIQGGKGEKPYFLAGGLNVDNIRTAISQAGVFAVDVSSGVETDGFKDSKK
jgi:phosphoribosylanthranilate isomerase